jgi:hypothetical protein
MRDADVYRVGSQRYLVAPLSDDTLDALIIASGSTEDMEPETDLGIDDEPHDAESGDMALGWAAEGSQLHLTSTAEEDEPELAWPNTGSQLQLAGDDGWGRMNMEGDGACDAEASLGWSAPGFGRSAWGEIVAPRMDQSFLTASPDDRELDPCDRGEPEDYNDG